MKKKTILNIFFGLSYYIFGIIGFFYLFIFAILFGIIQYFSDSLFWTCFLIIPIIILILPVILKFALKKEFYKSILLSLISVVIYFILIFLINFSILKYMSKFTYEKWTNEKYYHIRYLMIDDLEEKYNFVEMNKEEVTKILGKESEHNNYIYYFVRSKWLRSYYYCLEYDENGIITKNYINID